jgi:hypothetical protein
MRNLIGTIADHLCTPLAERLGLWRVFHPVMEWAWERD